MIPKMKSTPSTPPKYLGRKQAAEYLGISVTTLDRYAKAGEIPFKIRRRCHPVFEVADLDRFNRPLDIPEYIKQMSMRRAVL